MAIRTQPRKASKPLATLLLAAAFTLPGAFAHADPGVTENEILLGQSDALTGPTSARPLGLLAGQALYLKKINAAGGVYGRKIRVIAYDDKYDPKEAAENVKKLIEQDKVFAFLNNYGTPTVKSSLPVIMRAEIPLVAPGAGAEFLRTPPNRNIFNVKPGFSDEAEGIIAFLTKRKIEKIAFFSQGDSFGEEGRLGIVKALNRRNLSLGESGTYARNTTDFAEAYKKIKNSSPQAVVIWANSAAGSDFIRKASEDKWNTTFVVCSPQLSDEFLANIKGVTPKVFATLVYPYAEKSSLPIAREYVKEARAAHVPTDTNGFEGYIATAVFVKALTIAGKDLTRSALRETFEKKMGGINIGGLVTEFSSANHQAFSKVYLAEVVGGKLVVTDR